MSMEKPQGIAAPIMVAAFEGWNDAGEAATAAVDHLIDVWDAELICELDPEDYHDFQVNRPIFSLTEDGSRVITWPTTRIYHAKGPECDILLARGVEPSIRWLTFADELVNIAREAGCKSVVTLGAMLADVPHTRPLPVASTSDDDDLRERLDLTKSGYEGPTGIVGVLLHAAGSAGLETLSMWVSLPHYVGQTPSPKGAVALLERIEDLTRVSVPPGSLADDAHAWEHAITALAEQDEEIALAVAHLEEQTPASDLPKAQGAAIARDFERYLRRRSST